MKIISSTGTVSDLSNGDCLYKNTPIKHNTYIVNKKLKRIFMVDSKFFFSPVKKRSAGASNV
jgi:hypothetical protein